VLATTVLSGAQTLRMSDHSEVVYRTGEHFVEYPDRVGQVVNATDQVTTVAASAIVPRGNAITTVLPSLNCLYFTETKHSLCMGFRTYWEAFGGLAVYGYPITEEVADSNGVTVQWFERARFEWRPGTWPERYDVHLGRIGTELVEQRGIGLTP
jgi:hypothetical protein